MNTDSNLPLITDLKPNSLDDGPGIRSVIFFKGCPLSCVWCHNPETINPKQTVSFTNSHCIGIEECGIDRCISACSQNAIESASPIKLNSEKCNECGACVEICDMQAFSFSGRQIDVDELVSQIEQYIPFYHNSNGGVTLSGGEATLYPDYCESLLKRLKPLQLHILLETSGFFNSSRFFRQIYPYLDQIYFDLKIFDNEQHKRYCGTSNRNILDNFRELAERAREGKVPMLARIPLIPEITTTHENLSAIANFLMELEINEVALLPYNPMWRDKAEKLIDYPRDLHDSLSRRWMTETEIEESKLCFREFNIINMDQ